jgi:hypothetical protein
VNEVTPKEATTAPPTPGAASRSWLLFVAALLAATAILAAAQSYSLWGTTWFWASFYWPNVASFLLPVIAFGALIAAALRWLAPGHGEGLWLRRWVWIALVVRVASVAFWPVALRAWGYRSPEQQAGFIATDAFNASQLAWERAQSDTPAVAAFARGHGDNTGGITFLGVVAYRAFSPDFQRPLMLGLVASSLTALTVLAAYHLARMHASRPVAQGTAIVVALYPEAVVIGSAHLQQGYLALLLGFMLWGLSAAIVRGVRPTPEVEGPLFKITRRGGGVLAIASLVLMTGVSLQFGILAAAVLLVAAVWLADWRSRGGRILVGLLAAIVVALVALHFLSEAEIVPDSFNVVLGQLKFLFGQAWTEFDRMLATPGTDLFESLMVRMPRQLAFVVAGFYGLLQPVLPAAIGYRNVEQSGGGIWQVLGLLRASGWYVLLPLLVYGGVASLRRLQERRFEAFAGLLFWMVSAIASYRALGDQWDNPRYRLFVLVPMAFLAAWAYVRRRETRSPWLPRVVVPFVVACVAMTAWYIARYWLAIRLPALPVLAGVVGASALTFLAMLVWPRLHRRRSMPGNAAPHSTP